jgi:hypothetical protein
MKLVKASGLAVIAAVAAMALVGTSTAMAGNTAICKSNEGGALACAEANQYKTTHSVALDAVILNSFANVLCESSLLQVTHLGLGAPQVGHVTALTWTGCKAAGVSCTVTTPKLGTLLFLKTAVNLGEAQFHGMTILVQCALIGFECLYEGLPTFHLLGATSFGNGPENNGGVRGVESTLTTGPFDGPCPPGVVLDLFWESLTPVYTKS